MADEGEISGYLFKDGELIEFYRLVLDEKDYSRETGALRIRVTPNELDVDFLEEMKPTPEQINTIKKLKTAKKKLFFEIVDRENYHVKGYGGFDKTISEMEEQINEFYNKNKDSVKNAQLPNTKSLKE